MIVRAFAMAGGFVLAGITGAQAQDPGRIAAVGTVEFARITEDEGYLGAGLGLAGGVEFDLTAATSVAVEIGRQRHVRDLALAAVAFDDEGRPVPLPYIERWEGTAAFAMGHVARRFGSARFRPVVWGGAGLMFHGGTRRGPVDPPQVPPGHTLQPGDAVTREGRSVRAFTYEGGYGVDIPFGRRLTLRPFVALRLANTGNAGPKYIIHSGGRIAFR